MQSRCIVVTSFTFALSLWDLFQRVCLLSVPLSRLSGTVTAVFPKYELTFLVTDMISVRGLEQSSTVNAWEVNRNFSFQNKSRCVRVHHDRVPFFCSPLRLLQNLGWVPYRSFLQDQNIDQKTCAINAWNHAVHDRKENKLAVSLI